MTTAAYLDTRMRDEIEIDMIRMCNFRIDNCSCFDIAVSIVRVTGIHGEEPYVMSLLNDHTSQGNLNTAPCTRLSNRMQFVMHHVRELALADAIPGY